MEKDEVIPIASTMFKSYREAAERGHTGHDCVTFYRNCPHDLIDILRNTKL